MDILFSESACKKFQTFVGCWLCVGPLTTNNNHFPQVNPK